MEKYAADNGFENAIFLVDDGYSGTNFERPSWKKVIEMIEADEVDTLIVKDMSRLGREYLQVGQLTELYLPTKGVRFIAINDGVDSLVESSTDFNPIRNWAKNKRCLGGGTTKGSFMNFQMDKLQVLLHTAFTRPDRQSGKTL